MSVVLSDLKDVDYQAAKCWGENPGLYTQAQRGKLVTLISRDVSVKAADEVQQVLQFAMMVDKQHPRPWDRVEEICQCCLDIMHRSPVPRDALDGYLDDSGTVRQNFLDDLEKYERAHGEGLGSSVVPNEDKTSVLPAISSEAAKEYGLDKSDDKPEKKGFGGLRGMIKGNKHEEDDDLLDDIAEAAKEPRETQPEPEKTSQPSPAEGLSMSDVDRAFTTLTRVAVNKERPDEGKAAFAAACSVYGKDEALSAYVTMLEKNRQAGVDVELYPMIADFYDLNSASGIMKYINKPAAAEHATPSQQTNPVPEEKDTSANPAMLQTVKEEFAAAKAKTGEVPVSEQMPTQTLAPQETKPEAAVEVKAEETPKPDEKAESVESVPEQKAEPAVEHAQVAPTVVETPVETDHVAEGQMPAVQPAEQETEQKTATAPNVTTEQMPTQTPAPQETKPEAAAEVKAEETPKPEEKAETEPEGQTKAPTQVTGEAILSTMSDREEATEFFADVFEKLFTRAFETEKVEK